MEVVKQYQIAIAFFLLNFANFEIIDQPSIIFQTIIQVVALSFLKVKMNFTLLQIYVIYFIKKLSRRNLEKAE